MTQILLHLPDELVRRFKQSVPARERSRFVERLLEEALPDADDDPLYLIALEVQKDEALNAEMAEWESATVSDGLENLPPWREIPEGEHRFTAGELAARLGVEPKALRRRLRRLGLTAGSGRRYRFDPVEFDRLVSLLAEDASEAP